MAKGNTPTPRANRQSGGSGASGGNTQATVQQQTATTQNANPQKVTQRDIEKKAYDYHYEAAIEMGANSQQADDFAKKIIANNPVNPNYANIIPSGWNNQVVFAQYEEYGNGMKPDAQIAAIAKKANVSTKEAADMYDALDFFTGAGYQSIHKYQGGDEDYATPKVMAYVDHLENFIAKSPKVLHTTRRGTSWDDVKLQSCISMVGTNKTIKMHGTASWSSSDDTKKVEEFASNGKLPNKVILICKGGQPLGTPIRHLSNFYNEEEVLVSAKAQYKITKYNGKKQGFHIFEVEAV